MACKCIAQHHRHSVFRLYRYRSSLKEAFASFKKESGMDDFAVLVGVRRTDPYCGKQMSVAGSLIRFAEQLREIQMTNNDWPRFLRIHPILDWDYANVWTYLDTFHHQYCSLYSHGYTSIGGKNLTVPNPALRLADGTYLHARSLQSARDERAGRLPKPNL
jgi:FAD synthetase